MPDKQKAAIIYPHQLFTANPAISRADTVYIVEDPLFFAQYRFHKKKLILHRASMKAFALRARNRGSRVRYVEVGELQETGDLASLLAKERIGEVLYIDPVDDWLESRLIEGLELNGIAFQSLDSPMFLNSRERVEEYFRERERLGILMDADGNPEGGKLTFDTENRKKLPKGIELPVITAAARNEFVDEAIEYVEKNFGGNPGSSDNFAYPVTHEEAESWLEEFLETRLRNFGPYQDAIAKDEGFLFHSVLTPMMNCGLLTPARVVDKTLEFAEIVDVPMNSLEGFIRQVIGWREFMRGVYVSIGRKQRSSNFWGHDRPLPESFWTGETGIDPVDDSIRRLLDTGYSHHIERLMIFANFLTLTEIRPNDAYRWFMEMYVDAYDWVMVPNVYGMGLFADGGLITTKPYISGSNYIRKMSDYGDGEWSKIWDGLYWRFIGKHKSFFDSNPRLRMMPRLLDKMDDSRRLDLLTAAEDFLDRFHQN